MATYKLDSAAAARQIRVMSMGGEPRARMRENAAKLSPDGKPTYSTGVVAAREDGGQDRGVTVAVIEPQIFPLGTMLRPDGDVWLTPYVSDNGNRASAGMSIVATRLVPVDGHRAEAAPKVAA
jgi:hypothetical protein